MPESTPATDITLALPAYNEESNIRGVLDDSVQSLENLGRSWEIIVIDNHSSDNTAQVVENYARQEPRVRLVRHESNRLYSGSCATAMREARGRYLAIMDSDGQFVAADLPKFIQKLESGANFVLGWRRQRNDPFSRIVISGVFNLMGKWMLGFPLHDLNCGIRMFDRTFLQAAEIKHRINMANPELYVRGRIAGCRMDEVEIQHFERFGGVTSHNFRKLLQIFATVYRYFSSLRADLKDARKQKQPNR